MTSFEGDGKIGFGPLGFLSHLFISLGVLVVFIALFGWLFDHSNELFTTMIGAGSGSVIAGIGLGFINLLFS